AAWVRSLMDQGIRPVPVSVNVSRADIYLMDVSAELHALVERYGIDPSLIEVEITESAYSERPDRIVAAFDALAERGFTVLMDDFGSGYSSLNMLKDINVDVLKIDMRFLDRDDRRSKDIMESVIRMARWLDLPVIAEGVETREQVNFLLDVGCSYAQGYYYARPMEVAAFESMLADGSNVEYEQRILQEARRPVLDFKDLLHENIISDRMLTSIIGAVALYTYADGDLRLVRGNEAYHRLVSTLDTDLRGAEEGGSVLPFVFEEDRAVLLEAAEESVRSCADNGAEAVVRRAGTRGCRWHKLRLFHLSTTGGVATLYATIADVTAHMEDMEALRMSEQRFEIAMEATSIVVFELDLPTRIARYSEFVQHAFGLSETVVNAPEGFIEQNTVADESIDDFRRIYDEIYAGAPKASTVVRANMGDGSTVWNRVTLMAVPKKDGLSDKAVGLVENVTREKEMELSLEHLAQTERSIEA
ncbi:sensor domain-containing phosphodiesterase, partial [Eggerthella sinensis]|uniref:sensor domain-containing phosphodiesterase n=3 Tax=Eggerthella TaxID=84111 RepID=UPI00248D81DD